LTIQIDDAGWGDLLGGVIIAAYRIETEQFAYRLIDVKFFQEPAFDEKHYLDEASKAAQELLSITELNAPKSEPIQLCTGYILSRAVYDLNRAGYKTVACKIIGPLQERGEQAFLDELRKMGYDPMPNREADGRARAKSFYDMLNWAKAKPERMSLIKSGWRYFTGKPKRKWRRWGENEN